MEPRFVEGMEHAVVRVDGSTFRFRLTSTKGDNQPISEREWVLDVTVSAGPFTLWYPIGVRGRIPTTADVSTEQRVAQALVTRHMAMPDMDATTEHPESPCGY